MPSRPRQHVLEELSKRAFCNAMPPEWIIRSQESDYGIDLQVQLVQGKEVSNVFFFVQLKSSESLEVNGSLAAYRFKTDRLRHYLDSPLPVMLVAYDAKEDRLYYEWAHDAFGGLDLNDRHKWRFQESVTVALPHALVVSECAVVEAEVKQFFRKRGTFSAVPGGVGFSISVQGIDGFQAGDVGGEVFAWIARHDGSSRICRAEGSADIEILLDLKGNRLECRNLRSGVKADLSKLDKGSRMLQSHDSVLVVLKICACFLIASAGVRELSLDLLRSVIQDYSGALSDFELMIVQPHVASLFAESRRAPEALELAEVLLEKGHADAAVCLATAAHIQGGSEFLCQGYRRIQKLALEREPESVRKAMHWYGIANSLRSSGNFKESFRAYVAAAESDLGYLDRAYWWSEAAGCLFLAGCFRLARIYYEVAAAVAPDDPRVRQLWADSLLTLGRYGQAEQVFGEALRQDARPRAEFVLKGWLSAVFARNCPKQFRRRRAAFKVAKEAWRQPPEEQEVLLGQSVGLDLMCDYAWFNYAAFQAQKNPEDARHAWLAAATLSLDWDPEACANAVLHLWNAMEKSEMMLMMALLDEAVRRHRGSFWRALEAKVQFPPGRDGDVQKFVGIVRELAERAKFMFEQPNETKFLYRIL